MRNTIVISFDIDSSVEVFHATDKIAFVVRFQEKVQGK